MSLQLVITGRTRAARWLNGSQKEQIRYVVSIGAAAGHMVHPNRGNPYGFSSIKCPKLRLEFDDIEAEAEYRGNYQTHTGPTSHHVRKLINFARKIDWDQDGILLVHCYVGKSRSTAASYIILATLWGQDRAYDAALHVYKRQAMFQRYGYPSPNGRMITLASDILGWDLWPALSQVDDEWLSPKWNDYKAQYKHGTSQAGRLRPPPTDRDLKKQKRKIDTRRKSRRRW